MKRDLLTGLLSARPPETEIAAATARARRRALDAPVPPVRGAGRLPASRLVFAAVLAGILLLPPAPRMAEPAQRQDSNPLRMVMTLSDGTKVVWVFNDRFAL